MTKDQARIAELESALEAMYMAYALEWYEYQALRVNLAEVDSMRFEAECQALAVLPQLSRKVHENK